MANQPTFITLSSVKAKKVDWFWPPLIPFGMITIMEGDPGEGKSFLAMNLTTLITKGAKLPNGTKLQRGNVLYLSSEDDAAYTIRPRIDAMGGDADRVRILGSILSFDESGLEELREELDESEPDVIVIDPIVAFIPEKSNTGASNQMRALLGKLNDIASEYGCAIILIRHLIKMRQEKAIYQGGGTVDFIAAARSAVRVAEHPSDPTLRVMAHMKHNIGPKGQSWLFKLVETSEDMPPKFEWVGPTSLTVEDLNGSTSNQGLKPMDAAKAFLLRELEGGPRKATEMIELADMDGITERTLKRAKPGLGVISIQKKSGWIWKLPKKAGPKAK